MRYDIFQTALTGPLVLAGDDRGLQHLNFLNGKHPLTIAERWHRDPGFFTPVRKQLAAYLAGERQRFDIDLNLQGTAFQRRVWAALQDIAYGEVVSYQWIASRIGNPAAVRAVGAANGRNPVSIIVPCHRVIGKGGHLTGYGGGLAVKHRLLQLENPDWR